MNMKKYDLENRPIDFSVMIIDIVNDISGTKAGNHLSSELIRCGTSVALNYGEAQSAESRKDFIHKLKIILKELRESNIDLKIIKKSKLHKIESKISASFVECDELISIFVKSILTAKNNQDLE